MDVPNPWRRLVPLLAAALLAGCEASQVALSHVGSGPGVVLGTADPKFDTVVETLHEELVCTPFTNPDKEPVLLVHGTFTYGEEQYDWSYIPWLRARGFDVCVTSYPDRGFGDLQNSAEYVAYAVLKIHQETGRKVDMAGHSQGGLVPRWAIRWWPGVRDAVDDFVMHASPNHGTTMADSGSGSQPPAFWQMRTDSNFVAALNAPDETPGNVSYTSVYTSFDELVQPAPVPVAGGEAAAELEPGQVNQKLTNAWLQGICPQNTADHVSIGTTDGVTALLTVDAFLNAGPADFERAGGATLCTAEPIADSTGTGFTGAGAGFFSSVPTGVETVDQEPPLKPYAQ